MPPNLEKRTSWKLAAFHTLSHTAEVFRGLPIARVHGMLYIWNKFSSLILYEVLHNRCHLGTLWDAEW